MEKLNIIFNKLNETLDEAIKDSTESLSEFCNSKIFKLGKFIGLYHDLLKVSNVDCNEDLKESLNDTDKTCGLYQNLEEFLTKWNLFLDDIEEKYHKSIINQQTVNAEHIDTHQKLPIEVTDNNEYFIELNSKTDDCNRLSFRSICEKQSSKNLVLVLLRHFA
jgi:hypothetical protein